MTWARTCASRPVFRVVEVEQRQVVGRDPKGHTVLDRAADRGGLGLGQGRDALQALQHPGAGEDVRELPTVVETSPARSLRGAATIRRRLPVWRATASSSRPQQKRVDAAMDLRSHHVEGRRPGPTPAARPRRPGCRLPERESPIQPSPPPRAPDRALEKVDQLEHEAGPHRFAAPRAARARASTTIRACCPPPAASLRRAVTSVEGPAGIAGRGASLQRGARSRRCHASLDGRSAQPRIEAAPCLRPRSSFRQAVRAGRERRVGVAGSASRIPGVSMHAAHTRGARRLCALPGWRGRRDAAEERGHLGRCEAALPRRPGGRERCRRSSGAARGRARRPPRRARRMSSGSATKPRPRTAARFNTK